IETKTETAPEDVTEKKEQTETSSNEVDKPAPESETTVPKETLPAETLIDPAAAPVIEEEEEEEEVSEYEEDGGEIEVEEFFVKYKNLSYLHCEWRTRDELFYSDKRIDQKIKRFKTKKQQ